MKREQEQSRSFDRGVATNPPPRWNRIDTSGVSHMIEATRERRLEEIRFVLQQEGNRQNKEKEGSQKVDDRQSDRFDDRVKRGFEPFVNPESSGETLFINAYNGAYSQKMELNRQGVERVLKIAHLNGQVILTTLSALRQRSQEAQGEELAAKRFRFFGERTQTSEEDNPLKRVVSTPEGWGIEINDQKLIEELTERGISGKELQRTFVNKFNGQLKEALKECVWREKLSSEKDRGFKIKLFLSLSPLSFQGPFVALRSSLGHLSLTDVSWTIGTVFLLFGLWNYTDRLAALHAYRSMIRKVDHKWEYFMPYIEIDKVAWAFSYLQIKGRRLAREIKE